MMDIWSTSPQSYQNSLHQMSALAKNLPVALCCLLTTLGKVQASCLPESPQSVYTPLFQPFFLHYFSNIKLFALPGRPFPSTPTQPLRLRAGATLSRKYALTMLCGTRRQNTDSAVPSTWYNDLSRLPPSTGPWAPQGRGHMLLVFATALLPGSWFTKCLLNLTHLTCW